jgi:hypothetical protein
MLLPSVFVFGLTLAGFDATPNNADDLVALAQAEKGAIDAASGQYWCVFWIRTDGPFSSNYLTPIRHSQINAGCREQFRQFEWSPVDVERLFRHLRSESATR